MKKTDNIKLNAILNIIKTLSSIIFPLITFPYISRVLQPENIGKINFATSFVTYFTLIASLGISTYAIRECSLVKNKKEDLERIGSQIFSINICTACFSYLLLAITLVMFRNLDQYRTLIIIQSLTISFSTLGCDWINSAMEDYKYITIRTILFQLISLVLMFIFVHNPSDYIKYAIISVVSSSGASIVNILYRKKYCSLKFTNKMDFKTHFRPIILLFVMILAQNIFNSSDITMIGLIRGDYEVGLYSTAVKLTNLIAQVVASLVWVILPKMSRYFENGDYEEINKMLKKILNVLLSIGVPCAIGTIMLSEDIITLVAGSNYMGAIFPLKILMISFVFNLIGEFFLGNMILLPSKQEKKFMILCCISTVLNLILNFIFIPKYGLNAASVTTMISTFLLMIMLIITKDKKISLGYLKEILFSVLPGSILIVIICIVTKEFINIIYLRILLAIGFSGIAYFLTLLILKNELIVIVMEYVKKIIKKIKTSK